MLKQSFAALTLGTALFAQQALAADYAIDKQALAGATGLLVSPEEGLRRDLPA